MENKQKLPKHITAHEDLDKGMNKSVVLRSKVTGKCWYTYQNSPDDIKNAVKKLNNGRGWDKDGSVGKQIVF